MNPAYVTNSILDYWEVICDPVQNSDTQRI